MKISRHAYAEMFGPTTGDRVRLADSELFIEIEHDFTIYGEEVKFGGGKVIRDGMGQSQRTSKEAVDSKKVSVSPKSLRLLSKKAYSKILDRRGDVSRCPRLPSVIHFVETSWSL